jgi:hypothetical protein
MHTHSNFLLTGHLAGTTKIAVSLSFAGMIMLHATELRKDLVQSKLEGFNKKAIKNSFHEVGTRLLEGLLGASKYLAHNLKPSTALFLYRELCFEKPGKTDQNPSYQAAKPCPRASFQPQHCQ